MDFKNIKFDHTKNKKNECLGITYDRYDELLKACSKSIAELFVLDESITDVMMAFERCLSYAKPKTESELVMITMIFQSGYERGERMFSEIKEIL